MKGKTVLLVAAAGIAAALLGWWVGRRSILPLAVDGTVLSEGTAVTDLQARIAHLEKESAELRERLRQAQPGVPQQKDKVVQPVRDEDAARQIIQLQARLATAGNSLSELQAKTRELEESAQKLAADNRRMNEESGDLRENLATTRRLVQAMETELKTKTDRLSQLEEAARRARDESSSQGQKLNQISTTIHELEDLSRRRENLIVNLQRRYRDLTDQYRSLAVRMDTQRDNPVAFAPDVSRIQSVVQSSEDDLRQLSSLNTQAVRVGQRLSSAK